MDKQNKNIVDTCCKVESKGKINKISNFLLTGLEASRKENFVFVKINNVIT